MRVLIISYYFPPNPAVGGVRALGLAKYLPQFGYEPLVLTPVFPGRKAGQVEVIETEDRDVLSHYKAKLRLDPKRSLHDQWGLSQGSKPSAIPLHTRVLNFAASCISYPDPRKGWLPFALEAVRKLQAGPRVGAILSSAPPICCAMLGARAKAILGCPWIADFRDLWVDNLASTTSPLVRRMQRRLEKKTLAAADVLVTVSEPWANRLRQSHPAKRVITVANGFDPADFAGPRPPLTPFFSLTYTGQLYQGKRDPSQLLAVLQQLFREGLLDRRRVRVRFYGPQEAWLAAIVENYGLQDVVEIGGKVARSEAQLRQCESQVLLQLGWADPQETGQHTGKLFEYLGARRPILAVGGVRGVMTDLLDETGAGLHALSEAELRRFLLDAYREFESQGCVAYRGQAAAVDRYTHIEMARRMAAILAEVAGNGKAPQPSSVAAEEPVITR